MKVADRMAIMKTINVSFLRSISVNPVVPLIIHAEDRRKTCHIAPKISKYLRKALNFSERYFKLAAWRSAG